MGILGVISFFWICLPTFVNLYLWLSLITFFFFQVLFHTLGINLLCYTICWNTCTVHVHWKMIDSLPHQVWHDWHHCCEKASLTVDSFTAPVRKYFPEPDSFDWIVQFLIFLLYIFVVVFMFVREGLIVNYNLSHQNLRQLFSPFPATDFSNTDTRYYLKLSRNIYWFSLNYMKPEDFPCCHDTNASACSSWFIAAILLLGY